MDTFSSLLDFMTCLNSIDEMEKRPHHWVEDRFVIYTIHLKPKLTTLNQSIYPALKTIFG